IEARAAALGEFRSAAGVAHSRAAPGVPAPDEVVAEEAGHVAAQLVGVEWPMIGKEEVTVASVRTGGLTRKDPPGAEERDGGGIRRVLVAGDAARARVLERGLG